MQPLLLLLWSQTEIIGLFIVWRACVRPLLCLRPNNHHNGIWCRPVWAYKPLRTRLDRETYVCMRKIEEVHFRGRAPSLSMTTQVRWDAYECRIEQQCGCVQLSVYFSFDMIINAHKSGFVYVSPHCVSSNPDYEYSYSSMLSFFLTRFVRFWLFISGWYRLPVASLNLDVNK